MATLVVDAQRLLDLVGAARAALEPGADPDVALSQTGDALSRLLAQAAALQPSNSS